MAAITIFLADYAYAYISTLEVGDKWLCCVTLLSEQWNWIV